MAWTRAWLDGTGRIHNHRDIMSDTPPTHTPNGAAVTQLIQTVFLVNAQLIADGDHLTRDLGFTSARWQVLGAAGSGLRSVAQLARHMSLTRQSVQRLVDWLVAGGYAVFIDNPDHQRAKLVQLTQKGIDIRRQLQLRPTSWANEMGAALSAEGLRSTLETLRGFRQALAAAKPGRKAKR